MKSRVQIAPYVLNVIVRMSQNIFGVYDCWTINYCVILKKAVSF